MGPRTSIRGNVVDGRCPPPMAAFNGAADFHPRKRFGSQGANQSQARLQWGRGLPSAETRIASMSPDSLPHLQWGRGLPSAETFHKLLHAVVGSPSMGPRTSIRGNSAATGTASTDVPLQWGRGLPSAETPRRPSKRWGSRSLQWGRGLPSAETFTPWRTSASRPALQWGRGLPSAETNRPAPCGKRSTGSFNGAADFHPRKPRYWAVMSRLKPTFNGAADFHPRKRC